MQLIFSYLKTPSGNVLFIIIFAFVEFDIVSVNPGFFITTTINTIAYGIQNKAIKIAAKLILSEKQIPVNTKPIDKRQVLTIGLFLTINSNIKQVKNTDHRQKWQP